MELDFLTIDQVVEILSKELGITCDTKNIAELVREKQLETVFWFKGYIGEVNSPCIKDGIDSFPLAKLTNTDGFLKPSALHDQEIYDLLINEKTAIDISLVCKEQNLFVLFPDCDEDLIQDVLRYTRYDEKKKQLINEAVLVENFPLIIHDLTSKGATTSVQVTLNQLRITKESLHRWIEFKGKTKSDRTLIAENEKLLKIIGAMIAGLKKSSKFGRTTQNQLISFMEDAVHLSDAKIGDDTIKGVFAKANDKIKKYKKL
ncbi:hypothetical protein [Acinetobacter variabilis]|uniref:hypothetical protein n=1 Tax=Acinetobacter variabilis TaxID=70346 RepID=UPI0028A22C13|nr:hypothetical protein [Acinetobacter variabilis]